MWEKMTMVWEVGLMRGLITESSTEKERKKDEVTL